MHKTHAIESAKEILAESQRLVRERGLHFEEAAADLRQRNFCGIWLFGAAVPKLQEYGWDNWGTLEADGARITMLEAAALRLHAKFERTNDAWWQAFTEFGRGLSHEFGWRYQHHLGDHVSFLPSSKRLKFVVELSTVPRKLIRVRVINPTNRDMEALDRIAPHYFAPVAIHPAIEASA